MAEKKKKYNDFVGKDGESKLFIKVEMTDKVEVECVEASALRAADSSTSDPFCKVFWNDVQIHKTKYISKKLDPNWSSDPKLESSCFLPYQALKVEMYDKDTFTKNDFHGELILRSDAFSDFQYGEQTHALCPKPGKEGAQGTMTIDLQVLDRLQIHVFNAMSLSDEADVSWRGKKKAGDPYVKVFHNGSQVGKKTKHKSQTTKPIWDEYRETYIPKDCTAQKIRFELYDHDMVNMNFGKDETLGIVELDGVEIQNMLTGAFKPFKLRKDAGSRGQDIQMGWLGIRFLVSQAPSS
jgi:Ca2+-dependent lipid-binding protein